MSLEVPLTTRALITGITGQDGSYLAEHLLEQGYEVWGLVRGQANPHVSRLRKRIGDVRLAYGDLLDQGSLISAVERVRPDEVYNLGAISFVPMSWHQAAYSRSSGEGRHVPWAGPKNKEDPLARRALITGITGQDGSYLAEHLLDQGSLISAVERVRPDEVYNLGAISFVPMSWHQAEITAEVTGMGVLRMLEAIRVVSGISGSRTPGGGQIRFYQASSSEMFGQVRETPQNERTPFHPRSPYGVAKTYGHFITQNYRESYGMFAVSGILFNHESPRRGAEFVTRKISLGVARIKLGLAGKLTLGNLEARRDWGYAGDYVQAMRLMLAAETPEDYVIGTGRTQSVRELVELAFATAGLDWQDHVETDSALTRPAEVDLLCGDPKKARDQLGWEPKVSFEELVAMMVESDLALLSRSDRPEDEPLSFDHW